MKLVKTDSFITTSRKWCVLELILKFRKIAFSVFSGANFVGTYIGFETFGVEIHRFVVFLVLFGDRVKNYQCYLLRFHTSIINRVCVNTVDAVWRYYDRGFVVDHLKITLFRKFFSKKGQKPDGQKNPKNIKNI